jgi:16S rRNA (uracil1498-N3)-methyltransferase
MSSRFHVPGALVPDTVIDLPAGTARHVQVLRLQPGDALRLFNGEGGEWDATVTAMGRQQVQVRIDAHHAVDRELRWPVTLVAAMPANDRFEWLIEKATELGATAIEPVMTERSVLRLSGERAERKREHWQAVAQAAAEQCGRTRVPRISLPVPLTAALRQEVAHAAPAHRLLLSLADAEPLAQRLRQALGAPPHDAREGATAPSLRLYSGPEGGFSATEEAALRAAGALPTTLGPRVLRAETAPLAVLATLQAWADMLAN